MPEPENTTIESAVTEAPDATTPEAPSTPIPASVDISPDVSAFERLSGVRLGETKIEGEDKPAPKAPQEPVEKEVELPSDKKEDTVEAKDNVEPEVKVVDGAQNKQKQSERDYSGLSIEEAKIAKQMSLHAFNIYRPLVIEHKKLKEDNIKQGEQIKALQEGKEILPPNYYENPNAVVFSPSYQSTAKNVELSGVIVQHWEQQLLKIEEGLANPESQATWTDLENDPKTGELILGAERPVTMRDKVFILSQIAHGQNQLHSYKQKLSSIVTNFKGENDKLINNIKNAEKEFFPAYEKPDDNTKKVMDQAKESIRNVGISESNPAFSPLVKSVSLNMQMVEFIKSKEKEIEDLKKKAGIKESIKRDAIRAGPSSGSLTSGSSKNGAENGEIPTYDVFKNLLTP